MQILRIVFWLPFTALAACLFSDSMTPLFVPHFASCLRQVPILSFSMLVGLPRRPARRL